ncbi:MAG: hypothetical protein VB035_05525 [Candidatus Fimivivens sp.]|nr:hypothetical protein [Candidatus Fimivivens sp.]
MNTYSLPYGFHKEHVKRKAERKASGNCGSCDKCRNLSYGYYCEYKKRPAGSKLQARRVCDGFALR